MCISKSYFQNLCITNYICIYIHICHFLHFPSFKTSFLSFISYLCDDVLRDLLEKNKTKQSRRKSSMRHSEKS